MAAPLQPTLGELTYRVAVRTGFGAQGGAGQVQRPIIEDFVKSAHAQLIHQYQDTVMRVVNDSDPGALSVGQSLYDIPDDMEPDELEEILLLTVDGDSPYPPLLRGISNTQRTYTERRRPQRFALRLGTSDQPQIELWPTPDQAYPVRMDYFMRPRDFRDPDDRASVNGELVFLHALHSAKAHYRQPDAEAVAGQFNALLGEIRYKQHKGRRYVRQGYSSAGTLPATYIPPKRV